MLSFFPHLLFFDKSINPITSDCVLMFFNIYKLSLAVLSSKEQSCQFLLDYNMYLVVMECRNCRRRCLKLKSILIQRPHLTGVGKILHVQNIVTKFQKEEIRGSVTANFRLKKSH
ncbi:hypothetical protein HZS_2204 [Henneguya salminicola]|nr:hypothetical protein HZS_2204 [Henneguya salminicola]